MNTDMILPILLLVAGSFGWVFIFQWQLKEVEANPTALNYLRTTLLCLLIWMPSAASVAYGIISLYHVVNNQWWTVFLIFAAQYYAVQLIMGFLVLGVIPTHGQWVGFSLVLAGSVVSNIWRS